MILVVNDYDSLYSKFWARLGGEVDGDPEVLFRDPASVKLVCFTGGEDVSPSLYGHKNLNSHNSKPRDEREVLIFEQAKKHKVPMTGICRGSQFLNVMCGGTMVQHLSESHGGSPHACITADGKNFEVTSSHHQMSVLAEGGEYLAWSEQSIPREACLYDGDLAAKRVACFPELDPSGVGVNMTEAFAYADDNIFAVQHHPEWQEPDCEAAQWTLQMIRQVCWGQRNREMEA